MDEYYDRYLPGKRDPRTEGQILDRVSLTVIVEGSMVGIYPREYVSLPRQPVFSASNTLPLSDPHLIQFTKFEWEQAKFMRGYANIEDAVAWLESCAVKNGPDKQLSLIVWDYDTELIKWYT